MSSHTRLAKVVAGRQGSADVISDISKGLTSSTLDGDDTNMTHIKNPNRPTRFNQSPTSVSKIKKRRGGGGALRRPKKIV